MKNEIKIHKSQNLIQVLKNCEEAWIGDLTTRSGIEKTTSLVIDKKTGR